jgi:hypothetical protein
MTQEILLMHRINDLKSGEVVGNHGFRGAKHSSLSLCLTAKSGFELSLPPTALPSQQAKPGEPQPRNQHRARLRHGGRRNRDRLGIAEALRAAQEIQTLFWGAPGFVFAFIAFIPDRFTVVTIHRSGRQKQQSNSSND